MKKLSAARQRDFILLALQEEVKALRRRATGEKATLRELSSENPMRIFCEATRRANEDAARRLEHILDIAERSRSGDGG